MREFLKRIGGFTLAVGVSAALACGGGAEEPVEGEEAAEQAGPVVPPDSAATITGVVDFEGSPPAPEPIDMGEEPTCAEKYEDQPQMHPAVVVDGKLARVYVYVKEGLGERTFPTPSEPVTLDQQGCRYEPHVLAIQVGQPLAIKNSDGILHNINTRPQTNRGFNISQPVEMTTTREFSSPEVMIPVKCDVHGWMEAYIGVQDHPYAAVSDSSGAFALENLPPGEYVIEAWHERYGTQTTDVSVDAGGSAEISFTYSAQMAGAEVPLGEPIDLHDHDGNAATTDRTASR